MPVADAAERSLTVETADNHAYFYSDVNADRCLALMRQLRGAASLLTEERLRRQLPENYPHVPIWLHILSGGGDVFPGLSVAGQIPNLSAPVYSIIEGYTASAATLISMACPRRFIQRDAFLLIHQVSAAAWGTYNQIRDEVHLLDMLMDRLIEFYRAHSKLPRRKLRQMLQRDTWLDAQEALKAGFVDEII